jgi:hypothetical protein
MVEKVSIDIDLGHKKILILISMGGQVEKLQIG